MARPDDGGPPRPGRGSPRRRLVAVAVVGTVGAAYVASALVAAAPINPLSDDLVPIASVVTQPYLVQNWQLFAPDPISEERGVVARLQCADGTTSGFADITSKHVEAIHSTRFFPSRQSRLVSNSMAALFAEDPYLARYRKSLEEVEGSQEQVLTATPDEINAREQGETILANLAHWTLAEECPTGATAAQLRYVMHKFPRWSERDRWRENGEVDIMESGWITVS